MVGTQSGNLSLRSRMKTSWLHSQDLVPVLGDIVERSSSNMSQHNMSHRTDIIATTLITHWVRSALSLGKSLGSKSWRPARTRGYQVHGGHIHSNIMGILRRYTISHIFVLYGMLTLDLGVPKIECIQRCQSWPYGHKHDLLVSSSKFLMSSSSVTTMVSGWFFGHYGIAIRPLFS